MPKAKNKSLPKVDTIQLTKISVFFRKPILKQILRILVGPSTIYRNYKVVKNINKLFTNLDLVKYKGKPDSEAYIWDIQYFSRQWLAGYATTELILEMAKREEEWNSAKEELVQTLMDDPTEMNPIEVKGLMQLVTDALQYGYIYGIKDECINLLDEIDIEQPGAFREIAERLFLISQSMLDIKHETNMVTNKVEFNTNDMTSLRLGIGKTIKSLQESGSIYKIGIKRLNTLLSPGYMNGRLYVYMGLPAGGKSLILLKTALDIRKYNLNVKPKTPGMKPAVLYVSMENSFEETIERIWNMTFDDPITNYTEEQAVSMLCKELGIHQVLKDDLKVPVTDRESGKMSELEAQLIKEHGREEQNIEIVVQYYPYRSISTDDLFTVIHDLRDENLEVCALVFDYIKRIEPANPVKDGNVKMELARIVNELKAMAVLLGIPVITAHQMNRAAAATVDAATRQGKGDTNKLVGRENVGDALTTSGACKNLTNCGDRGFATTSVFY